MSCVYVLALESAPENIRYVGRSNKSAQERLVDHLKASSGSTTHVYRWIKKSLSNGENILAIEIESGLTWEESGIREIYWIKEYRKLGFKLTNITDGGGGILGYSHTENAKERIRRAHLGRSISAETKEKIRIAATNQPHPKGIYKHTEEFKQKMRERTITQETRDKQSKVRTGKKATEETKAKMREVRKYVSEETRAKLSKAGLGNKSNTGRKLTEEHKANISKGLRNSKK